MGRKNKEVGASLLLPSFYVLPALSSQLSVFSKLCSLSCTPFCIFSVSYFSYAVTVISGTSPWVAVS